MATRNPVKFTLYIGFSSPFVFELWGAKAKKKGEFHWISCCHGNRHVKIITKTYLAIITLSNDTILLSLSDTEWFYNAIKRKGL